MHRKAEDCGQTISIPTTIAGIVAQTTVRTSLSWRSNRIKLFLNLTIIHNAVAALETPKALLPVSMVRKRSHNDGPCYDSVVFSASLGGNPPFCRIGLSMRVFVTGGNGLIGSSVVRQLCAANYDVVCLLRGGSETQRIDSLLFDRVEGDVLDRASLERGMLGCQAVLHLACPSSWDEIESPALEAVAVKGTRNVLNAAGGTRVVYVSSMAAVGATDRPSALSESAAYNLHHERGLSYAHAKHRAEALCWQAAAQGADVVVVNPAETYGPEDLRLVTAGNLIDFLMGPLAVVCRGGTCLAHVEDVAAGIIAAMERGRPGERYILGGDNLTHRTLARLVLEIAGRRKPVVTLPNTLLRLLASVARVLRIPLPFHPNVVPYATRYWFADNSKAVRELSVHFRSARATLEPTIAWLRAAGHIR